MAGRRGVGRWFRLVRFSHTLFAMPFALVGLVLGFVEEGGFSWRVLLLVLACMVLARSAAMGYNRLADRKIDVKNPRTAGREIPRGVVSARGARWFVGVCCVLFVVACGLLNWLVLWLSPVALLVILSYSHSKRFTSLCHYWLGLGLGLTPVAGYVAATGRFSLPMVVLGAGVALWTAGFDIIYSLQDEAFDREQGLHSVPVRLGVPGAIRVARITHLVALLLIAVAVALLGAGMLGYIALGCFTGTLIWQYSLFTARDVSRVDGTFMLTNGVNSVIFGVLLIADILL